MDTAGAELFVGFHSPDMGVRRGGTILLPWRRLRMARRSSKLWTPDEDEALACLWGSGMIARIARELGRSQSAIRGRAQKLGLKLTP